MEHARTSDPAPALSRGLGLLRLLEEDGASSLEALARKTGWPKTSVLRLLQSLELSSTVHRDPATKRYTTCVRLIPVEVGGATLENTWRPTMARVAAAVGHATELYRFAAGRLVMVDRWEPEDAEVTATARIGFARGMDEFDALQQLAEAFGGATPDEAQWHWHAGERKTIAREQAAPLLARAREERFAVDLDVNSNGVMRYAAPLLGADGGLLGVLAVAAVCLNMDGTPRAAIVDALKNVTSNVNV